MSLLPRQQMGFIAANFNPTLLKHAGSSLKAFCTLYGLPSPPSHTMLSQNHSLGTPNSLGSGLRGAKHRGTCMQTYGGGWYCDKPTT